MNANASYRQFENCKLKFSGGGFLYDIRYHTNHTYNLPEWPTVNGLLRQDYGRNVRGSFACLFESRQNTTGYNDTQMGAEGQQTIYSYDSRYNNAANLPPGTPMTTIVPSSSYTLQGAKWDYGN